MIQSSHKKETYTKNVNFCLHTFTSNHFTKLTIRIRARCSAYFVCEVNFYFKEIRKNLALCLLCIGSLTNCITSFERSTKNKMIKNVNYEDFFYNHSIKRKFVLVMCSEFIGNDYQEFSFIGVLLLMHSVISGAIRIRIFFIPW